MALDDLRTELARRRETALAMGGPAKLAARAAEGVLNARQRLDALLDPDSFSESGLRHSISASVAR